MRNPTIAVLLCSLLSAQAMAAGQMKPGLWEMTMKSDAMKNMPRIPAEQMEQMRRMGIDVPQVRDGAMVTRVCISRQMAESDQLPGLEKNEMGCQSKNMTRNGGGYSVDIVCNGPMMKGDGRAKGTFNGDESYSSTYDFKGTMHGQPVSQHSENSGRWLSADCGNIRPMTDMLPAR